MNKDRFKFRVFFKGRYVNEWRYLYIRNDVSIFAKDSDSELRALYGDCVIEQCTGRKDKNGKLIFEGDVLKIIWADRVDWASTREPKIHFFEVFYNGAYLTLREEETKIPHVIWKSEDYEIIGNIHELEDVK